MVLEAILAAKRRRLATQSPRGVPAASLRTGSGLAAAFANPWPALILECKAASPSAGMLIADYNPAALAAAYNGIADAISVLTEPEFFGGDLAHLAVVRETTRAPLLRKDFILGPEEVIEARVFGADAVLLMLTILDDADWQSCFKAAQAFGMDALTEVHDEAELTRALRLDAPIIGINNRNLHTLEVDIAVTERLAPLIPVDRHIVSESGIFTRTDILRLAQLVDGFLVGTSLSRSSDPARSARELAYGCVKICGLTRPVDAVDAWRAGAVLGGLIFAANSPRCIDLATARRIQAAAPLAWVGVFQNQSQDEVSATARALKLSAVQLHGEEDAAYAHAIRKYLPHGCEIWKAVPGVKPLPESADIGVDRLLLDTGQDGRLGGSGIALDATALSGMQLASCVLAGGIAPENVAAAASLGAWALDVNSGVEMRPGIKSAERMRSLFTTLRILPGRRNHGR
ncbi:MAG TPA: bifunctional indole-3-glycerol-phosphate synthase TrpC/phosphoribosylanthranilate isomerase TrpF [Gammaproteobacteria bacterium]|nr:bifunctional indole-3-glycerol-phosphate synthase TrpC/phosphoribosylanthranilate isomerase TrpF [Gammaproteobacteria bacterium]